MKFLLRSFAVALCAAVLPVASHAQQTDSARAAWNAPIAPFRIAPNLYYVGAADVTAYLFTSPRGHILLDGALPETAPRILANIKSLGFDARDVRILINSHAHFDHAGGLAEIQRATGAKMFASAAEARQLAAGGVDDYGLFETGKFPAVKTDSVIGDGSIVSLGDWKLRAVVTPGHTRGCTTWTTTIPVNGRPVGAVFMCGASVPGYKLVGNKGYPTIIGDYEKTFARLRTLDCTIFLAAHGGFFDLIGKAAKAKGDPSLFVDPKSCSEWIARNEKAFRAQVAREKAAAK